MSHGRARATQLGPFLFGSLAFSTWYDLSMMNRQTGRDETVTVKVYVNGEVCDEHTNSFAVKLVVRAVLDLDLDFALDDMERHDDG